MFPNFFKRILITAGIAVAGLSAVVEAKAANNYPVVLVHGFAGFGRGELLGYKYWGGLTDVQTQVAAKYSNQQIYTVAIGPFSSNWERAVELFYQIKGGCVDYGALHASQTGILRKPEDFYHNGRTCYAGYYPQWDANHPVHLISHSMGGQTARMLAQMLATNGAPLNPNLFPYATSAGWVKSVTAISTPNDGTTLAYKITDFVPFIQQLVAGFAGIAGVSGDPIEKIYDFKLDQFKIGPQQSGESFNAYISRVLSSPLFTNKNYKNISTYDLNPAGAMAINDWVKDQPNIYYFSYSTRATSAGLFGYQYPILSANPLIAAFGGPGVMGNFVPDSRPFPYSASNPTGYMTYWPSDDVVPTVAQPAPLWAMNSAGQVYKRNTIVRDITGGAAPQAGAWNVKGLMDGFDHLDIIGWTLFFDSVSFYKSHIDQLRSL